MKTIDYKAYFHAGYKGAADFNANILEPLFGANNVSNDQNEYIREEDKSFIQSIRRCGEYFLNGDPIEFFDVTLTDNCPIERRLQIDVKKNILRYIDNFSGVFIVFHYAADTRKKPTWRLSWVEKQKGNSDTTSLKRYNYLCGPDYYCRTIGERFNKLAGYTNKTLPTITDAFDVEALSIKFFEEYKVFYEDIVQYISGKRYLPQKGGSGYKLECIENPTVIDERGIFKQFQETFPGKDANGNSLAEKAVRDYAKKLLGRLVFIQFLQKKGWLGIPASRVEWEGGDTDFLAHLFSNVSSENKDNFVDRVLKNILFDSFNKPNSIYNGIKYPYLNGGLFERDKADDLKVKLPRALFVSEKETERKYLGKPAEGEVYDYTHAEGLFQFFDRYNFTIDENAPDDAIVGVDPEMLGKIFENLLEDNKDKGTYYTPKEVVQYMCRESLIAYLTNFAMEHNGGKATREVTEAHVRELIKTPETIVPRMEPRHKEYFGEALRNIKICDPAIGSGAFPMGLLNELVRLRIAIGAWADKPDDVAALKKEIIQNNIYGVDIEQGAIDIARLRFWLSIMVDLEEPEALPNFDYKFMQGNSLLEQYNGLDLSNVSTLKTEIKGALQTSIFDDNQDVYRNQLKGLLEKYFNCSDHAKRAILREQIANNVSGQLYAANCELDSTQINPSANTKFFLWHTWFKDVFDQGGFDIYIGNPPYNGISQNNAESLKDLINDYKKEPNSDQPLQERKHWLQDDYVKFIRVMEKLISDSGKGILCFITNSSFIDNPTFRGMRWHLMGSFNAIHVLDLHGNARKNDIQSGGLKDENVFNIMQGVAISMFMKTDNSPETSLFYADIVGSKKMKLSTLASSQLSMSSFLPYTNTNTAPFYLFVPQTSEGFDEYNKGFSIPDLFLLSATGVTTSRDSLVIDINKDELLDKITTFADVNKDDDEVRQYFFGNKRAGKYLPGDTRGWKMDVARKKIQRNNHQSLIIPFAFRIFDNRYIYYTPDMVDWGRENVFVNVINKANYCLVVPRQTAKNWRHVFISDKVSNFNFLATGGQNGAGTFFPLYSYRERNERYYNINQDIWNKIDAIIGRHASGEEIFDYVYAILHSENYRTLYEEFLKMDFPKIPYPKSISYFEQFSRLGCQLRLLHLFNGLHGKSSEYEFVGNGDNLVKKVVYLNNCIYINETQFFSNVSEKVWEKIFGDDHPLKRWLNERKGIYLSNDEIQYYKDMLYVISQTIVLEKQINLIKLETNSCTSTVTHKS